MFVMIQGIVGAFLVRIPVVYLVSRIPGATLFQIGLGTPASSLVQITLCLLMFVYLEKSQKKFKNLNENAFPDRIDSETVNDQYSGRCFL